MASRPTGISECAVAGCGALIASYDAMAGKSIHDQPWTANAGDREPLDSSCHAVPEKQGLIRLCVHGMQIDMLPNFRRAGRIALGRITAAGSATAALAANGLGNTLVGAFLDHRRVFHERFFRIDLAAGRLINVLFMRTAVAVGHALSADTLAAPGDADVFTLAAILDFRRLSDLRHNLADGPELVAAAMWAAAARVAAFCPIQERHDG